MTTTSPDRKIRDNVFLLSLLVLLPAVVLMLYFNLRSFRRAESIQTQQLHVISESVSSQHEQIIEGARQLLIALSTLPQIRGTASGCNQYLATSLAEYQRYGNFGVLDSDGNLICSAVPLQEPVEASRRQLLLDALSGNTFVVGEYITSPATQQASLIFGFPISDSQRIVYATLDLAWLNEFVSGLELTGDAELLVIDKNGVILARNPEFRDVVGTGFPDPNLPSLLIGDKGTIESISVDGQLRLYAYHQIGTSADSPYVLVGMSQSEIIREPSQNLVDDIVLTLVVSTVSLSVAWYIGGILIARTLSVIRGVDQLKRDFVSLVSHQIRTPLTAIKWFTQILLSKKPGVLNIKQKTILDDTLASTNRLIGLVGTLLDLSKLEQNKVVLEKQSTNLVVMIEDVVRELRPLYNNKRMKLKTRYSSRHIVVPTDRKLIRQVILNLLDNAMKYGNAGSTVEIRQSKNNGSIVVSISNHGKQIPDQKKGFLFTKFYRGDQVGTSNIDGSGLGLYACRLIVEAHNGSIWFTSHRNKTTFFFTLPIRIV